MSTTLIEYRGSTGTPGDAQISEYNTLPRDLRLSVLDHDVLTTLLEGLPIRSLRSLSSTSWHVRRLCLPVLFKRCLVASECPLQGYSFLPKALWPHVRHLRLADKCPDMPEHEDLYRVPFEDPILTFATDPLVCCLYDGPVLPNALSHMSRLHSISLELNYRTIHGIPWPVLQHILSLPSLREFTLKYHRLAPKTPPEEIHLDFPAQLTSFRF
ncbi:uncharacterized protein TRAVEDRAFT_134182, partial [Trametes versicolor FP-101664 SS1]|uniref:uncharacterized protein n=1 Tax=Trametes versicolor (strain FP-101664) TaxID=717944 RepID=UPI000462425A